MLRLFLSISFLLSATLAQAQSETALRAAAEAYVRSDVQQQTMDAMFSPEAIVSQMRANAPQLTEAQLAKLSTIVSEELQILRPRMETVMIETAAQTFSLSELNALKAFYETPDGRSAMLKVQPFFTTTMGNIAPELQAVQRRIAERAQKELAEE